MTSDLGFNWVRGQGSCGAHSSFLWNIYFSDIVACINGLGPGGGDGAESGEVQELHEIGMHRHFVGTVSLNMS